MCVTDLKEKLDNISRALGKKSQKREKDKHDKGKERDRLTRREKDRLENLEKLQLQQELLQKQLYNGQPPQHQMKWAEGMPCRAVYYVDGIEYEGVLMRMISNTECVVKFLGKFSHCKNI